jgi:hypothetical protein
MSLVVYRHENNKQFKKNGVGHTIKEKIIEGDRGLTFEFVKKEGNDFYRISAREVSKDMFNIIEKKGEKESTSDKGLADVKKMLSENKDLAFIKNYIEKERGTYKGLEDNKKIISGGSKKTKKTSAKKTSAKKTSVKKTSAKKTSAKKTSKKKKSKSLTGGSTKKKTSMKKASVKKASVKKTSRKKASKKKISTKKSVKKA